MKLQLFLNDSLFNELHIPEDAFVRIDSYEVTAEEAIDHRRQVINDCATYLKGLFLKQITRCKKYEIFLIVDSKPTLRNEAYSYTELQEAI